MIIVVLELLLYLLNNILLPKESCLVAPMSLHIGVDIGATFIRAGLFSHEGELLKKIKSPFPRSGFEEYLKNLIIDLSGGELSRIAGVGVGSIGPLDLSTGSVPRAPNAPIKSFRIVDPLRELGLRVVLANDAVAAAWGEHILGLARGYRNILYVTISTGIGGGVIVDGNLLIGKDGNAHEIGHLVVDYSSNIRCGCGGYGHWEGIASGINIPRSFSQYVSREGLCGSFKSPLCQRLLEGSLETREIFEQYARGDPIAIKYVDEYLMLVNSAGIASTINAYDPEILIMGGSVALNNKEAFAKGLDRYLDKYITVRKPVIRFTEFGDDVGIYGAAALSIKPPESLKEYIEAWNKR